MSRALRGQVLDAGATLSVEELSCACAMHGEWVLALVDEGILEPLPGAPGLRFAADTLAVARRVMRLQRDLGLNLSGAALALQLLDEIEALRARHGAGG